MSALAKNTLFLTLASIAQKAIAFLYFTLLARTVGVTDTGSYFLALALVTTIGVLDDVGLTSVLIREIAKRRDNATTWLKNVLGAKLAVLPVVLALAIFLPGILGFSQTAATLVRFALGILVADTLSLTFYGVLRGMQTLRFESLGIFVGQSLSAMCGAFFLVTHTATLPVLVLALTLGSAFNMFYAGAHVVRLLGAGALVPSFSLGLAPLRMAFAFFLAAVLTKIISYVDSFVLSHVLGDASVGLYSVAYKLTYAFQFLPLAFVGALYPTMSAEAHDVAALRKTFLDAEWYLSLLVAPIVFGLFALHGDIVRFFYGAPYAPSASVLAILVFVLLAIFFDFPVGSVLNATGRQATKTAILGVTTVLNIGANVILVPLFGIPGAAIAALVSFGFMFVVGFGFVSRQLHVSAVAFLGHVGGALLSGAVMAAIVMFVNMFAPWIVALVVGACVFVFLLFATRTLSRRHYHAFRSALSRPSYVENSSLHA